MKNCTSVEPTYLATCGQTSSNRPQSYVRIFLSPRWGSVAYNITHGLRRGLYSYAASRLETFRFHRLPRNSSSQTLIFLATGPPPHFPGTVLIHPPRLRPTIRLVVLIGRDVIAVFIEGHFAVVVPHVDFKLFPGSLALPAIVRVAQAEVAL